MRLDYVAKSDSFVLFAPHVEARELMTEHGLDWSLPASTPALACLFTREPYAAAAFGEFASPSAAEQLAPILTEIRASWAMQPARSHWPAYLKPDSEDPYPLQLADIEYIRERKHALDGDEMGIGKTATAIMWANLLAYERRDPGKFRGLVICPASIRLQWGANLRRWSTIPQVNVSVVTDSSRGVPPSDSLIHWTVVSYDCARSLPIQKALLRNNYDLLVIDEAHYLKSPSASRTRAILGAADRGVSISDRAGHVLALTGTPLLNRPREAFILARSLCHESIDFASERAFAERFNPRQTRKGKRGQVIGTDERTGRYHELQARLRANFMCRHLFADAFPQLNLPAYDLIYAEETAPVRAALEAERLLDIDPETFTGLDGPIDGAVSTARMLMGLALAPQVVNYVKMLHDGGEAKIVVFGWHREVLDILQSGLDRLGVVRVDGSTTDAAKAKAVVAFQTSPKIGVIIGNTLTLGTGIDGLQHVSRRAVLAEPDWVPGNNEQAIRRLYRAGQRAQVLADIFVARGSLAEHVLGTALRKGRIINKSLDARLGV